MENKRRQPRRAQGRVYNRGRTSRRSAGRARMWGILGAVVVIVGIVVALIVHNANEEAETRRYAEQAARNASVKTEFEQTLESSEPNGLLYDADSDK